MTATARTINERGLAARLMAEREAAARLGTPTAELVARISRYEERHHMRSDEMLAMLERGELGETAEISRWLIDLRLLRHVGNG